MGGEQPLVKPQSQYPEVNHGPGAKWIKHLTRDRITQFTDGHYSDINLSSVLYLHRLDDEKHVKMEVWSAPGLTKPTFQEAMRQKYKPAKKNDNFGPSCPCNFSSLSPLRTNHWFKVTLHIPSDWAQYERVQFEFNPGCEAMVYTGEGLPLQGITGGFGGEQRIEHIIPHHARKAGVYHFVIELSCNAMFGIDGVAPPRPDRYFGLWTADLVVPNQDAFGLLYDFQTLRELASDLPGDSALQSKALVTANNIMNVFQHDNPETIKKARKLAEGVFGVGWEAKKEHVYEEFRGREPVWGIGHCHIDTAWLWPYSVTQQKVARSWSTQLDLMDRYPEHRFAASSAQQYKWLEQLYPSLFERVREKVKSGQFHAIGGSWVENDANMPSGEALARQFIFGQRFFQTRFGKRSETAWLPDSFGLTGALPQLIRGAGMNYFFTQKLSWNNINTFPHTTFNWVGLDGTQVVCHMTPVDTYTAQATVGDVRRATTNHKNLESSDTGLLVFGNGDGGGGPLAKMLENLRRIRATANHSRDLQLVNMGRSVDDFFHDVEEHTEEGKTLPNWHGELYLEFHRGTYTSHGSIKRGNRKSEILLQDVEQIATLASIFPVKKGYDYPIEKINDLWEKVLLNQFHDVLPGSAIGMVYEDAEKLYAEVHDKGLKLLDEAFDALLEKSQRMAAAPLLKSASAMRVIGFNTVHYPRYEVVQLSTAGPQGARLKSEVVQLSKDGLTGYALMDASRGTNLAYPRGMFADMKTSSARQLSNGIFELRNSNVSLKIHKGRIVSLLDIAQDRELIPNGETGGLIIFNDQPTSWDAWETDIHHLQTPHPLEFTNIEVHENGPLRASLSSEVKYGQSKIAITISLDAITATLKADSRSFFRFDAKVDWHERHMFLKFEIPLNIHSPNATFETQFGNISRPTHRNTSWDIAKFEVCGHKYADLSEYGYGVAILNESKYGYAATGNVLRLSLLRAGTTPDAEQDQGKHEFSWAVLPHVGSFLESDVPIAAYFFNSPLHALYVPQDLPIPSVVHKRPFNVENAPNVVLSGVKRGDDDEFDIKSKSGSIVLRLYEAYGGHAKARLRISNKLCIRKAVIANLLEDDIETLEIFHDECKDADGVEHEGDSILHLSFRGFQVITVKLTFQAAEYSDLYPPKSDGWIKIGW